MHEKCLLLNNGGMKVGTLGLLSYRMLGAKDGSAWSIDCATRDSSIIGADIWLWAILRILALLS